MICHLSFVIRHLSFVIRHLSFVICPWLKIAVAPNKSEESWGTSPVPQGFYCLCDRLGVLP
jgi:hypothetical protein